MAEVRLDDILVSGQQYKIWDKHIATYRFKEKRTHVFELSDGRLTKFTNLKVEDVKNVNGSIPKVIKQQANVTRVPKNLLYTPVDTGDFMADYETNYANLKKIDQKAKADGSLLGRYVQEPYADGYAVYQVVEEKATKVKLAVVTGIGDDWVLPVWGRSSMVDKSYVQASIYRRDKLDELFNRK